MTGGDGFKATASSDLQCFEQFHQMGAMHAERFGGGGAVPLSFGEGAHDQFAPVAIDGVMVGQVFRNMRGLRAEHAGGKVMQSQLWPIA